MGLGSVIWKKPIPDPWVKKAPVPRSGSATLVRNIEPAEFFCYKMYLHVLTYKKIWTTGYG
jgi:hypothetical protein